MCSIFCRPTALCSIYYDPLHRIFSLMSGPVSIERLIERHRSSLVRTGKRHVVHIPALYGGEMGPDIAFVAEHTGIDERELVRIHTGTDYLVYMMGFSPGFAYLGGLDERLATPRLESPRTEIPAGAVGIAETQTGVYPCGESRRLAAHRPYSAKTLRSHCAIDLCC